ncbi:MAG: FG-GAP repeat protein, partial [Phycisphaerales bacterium JB061]
MDSTRLIALTACLLASHAQAQILNEDHKLLADDGALGDIFGKSVAVDGGVAIVGAYLDDDNGTDSGSAYLFNTTTGQQMHKLVPSDGMASDGAAFAVAVAGDYALVGANLDDDVTAGVDAGSVYVFSVSTGQQLHRLQPNDIEEGDNFGRSVAISGNIAIINSFSDDDNGTDSGSAYLFNAATGDQIAKLLP